MPITFACPNCWKRMTVADRHAGRSDAACPYCKAPLSVPLSSTAGPQGEPASFVADDEPAGEGEPPAVTTFAPAKGPPPPDPGEPGPPLRFACPQCRIVITASPAIVGQERGCPHCGARVVVPTTSDPPPSPPERVILVGVDLPFGTIFGLVFKVWVSVVILSATLGFLLFVLFNLILAASVPPG